MIDNVYAITPATGGAGATVVAIELAKYFASKGNEVAVIDLNLRSPVASRMLEDVSKHKNESSLVDFTDGKCEISKIICATKYKNIDMIYVDSNRVIGNILQLEEKGEAIVELIRIVKRLYDIVVIDCPNKMELMYVNLALYEADKVVVIVDNGYSAMIGIENTLSAMKESGMSTHTYVLSNKVKRRDVKREKLNSLEYGEVNILTKIPYIEELEEKIFCCKPYSIGRLKTKIGQFADEIYKENIAKDSTNETSSREGEGTGDE